MGRNTNIPYLDHTWNFLKGCRRVSEGCRNCYAEILSGRFSKAGQAFEGVATMTPSGARWTGYVKYEEKRIRDPLRWRDDGRVGVNFMSDTFHESVEYDKIDRAMAVAFINVIDPKRLPRTFVFLTKRAERCLDYASFNLAWRIANHVADLTEDAYLADLIFNRVGVHGLWHPRLWFGFSAEDQDTFDQRYKYMQRLDVSTLWLSAEPMLGWIDPGAARLQWVIPGAESGVARRPFNLGWARKLRDWCHDRPDADRRAFYFKQASGLTPGNLNGAEDALIYREYPRLLKDRAA